MRYPSLRLSRQSLKRQRVSSDHVSQRINKQIGTATTIEPESHFLEVGRKMFCRDFMPRTDNAALQQRECGLDAVRGDIAVNIDAAMWLRSYESFRIRPSDRAVIGTKLISHDDLNILADVLFDVLRQRPGFASSAWKNRSSPSRCLIPMTTSFRSLPLSANTSFRPPR